MDKITKFLTVFTFLAAAFAAQQSKGQLIAKQAIFVSGGSFRASGSKAKFYAFDIASKQVKAFDSVPGDYTNAVVISGDTAYFNVDTLLYRYNISTYKRIDSILLPGISNMVIFKDFLIISRGYPASGNYVEIYNKNTLAPLYKDAQTLYTGNGIVINNDTAYIALGGNDSDGMLEKISLTESSPNFVKVITLDTTSQGLTNIYTDGVNIYGLASVYGNSFNDISTYNLHSGKFSSKTIAVAENGVAFYNDSVYANFGKGLQTYNPIGKTFGSVIYPVQYTAGVFDSTDKDFFMVTSNYTTPDKVYEVNLSGKVNDSFQVGISTQAMAIQYVIDTTKSGIKPTPEATPNITLYPNPSNSKINIIYPTNEALITISDITGRTVYSANKTGINSGATIDVSGLTNGVYIVQLVSETGTADVKFIKE